MNPAISLLSEEIEWKENIADVEARNGALRELLLHTGHLEPWDRRPCPNATVGDLDLLSLREGLQRMKLVDAERTVESYLSDTEQLHALLPPLCARDPLTGELRPRNFTVLLFGRHPQRFIPGAFAYYSRYPGKDRAADYSERHEIVGSLLEQSDKLLRLLSQEATELVDKTNLKNPDSYRYPMRALQEALGNMLAHRDYCLYDPTRITSFVDRIEFLSPGALPQGLSIDRVRRGKVSPKWRNQSLAWIFIRLGLAQGEGQGLSTVRRELKAHGSPPPRYEADEVRVICTVKTHPLTAPSEIRALRER
jgi:ATP-dependent DNA helicase RecG